MRPESERGRLIARLSGHLERASYPRLQMLGIVTLAGLIGFLTSAALLHFGMRSMPLRYGLAALAGYVAFLTILRLRVERYRRSYTEATDLLDPVANLDWPSTAPDEAGSLFQGGDMSGGGAGRAIGAASAATDTPAAPGPGGTLDVITGAADADEGIVVLAPIILIVAIALAAVGALTVVFGAPGLLAEAVLDALIASAAYRRLRAIPAQSWLAGVGRRTWKAMLGLLLLLVAAAAIAQWLVPSADSVGDFFR